MPKPKQYVATLTRGKTYILLLEGGKSLEFLKGVPKIISAEHKELLAEQAVDHVTVGSGEDEEDTANEPRSKFSFKKVVNTDSEDGDEGIEEEDEDEDEEEEDEEEDEAPAVAKKQASRRQRK